VPSDLATSGLLTGGHLFIGKSYDRCPECFSPDTEEVVDEKDGGHW